MLNNVRKLFQLYTVNNERFQADTWYYIVPVILGEKFIYAQTGTIWNYMLKEMVLIYGHTGNNLYGFSI